VVNVVHLDIEPTHPALDVPVPDAWWDGDVDLVCLFRTERQGRKEWAGGRFFSSIRYRRYLLIPLCFLSLLYVMAFVLPIVEIVRMRKMLSPCTRLSARDRRGESLNQYEKSALRLSIPFPLPSSLFPLDIHDHFLPRIVLPTRRHPRPRPLRSLPSFLCRPGQSARKRKGTRGQRRMPTAE
jgi:hypothetical protein